MAGATTTEHVRNSVRLGHDAAVSCTCGWGSDWSVEVHGESGDDVSRKVRAVFARHVKEAKG